MERASKASVAMRSAAERVSGVSGASERTKRATEWPFQNAIVKSRNRPLFQSDWKNPFFLLKEKEKSLPSAKRTKGPTDGWTNLRIH